MTKQRDRRSGRIVAIAMAAFLAIGSVPQLVAAPAAALDSAVTVAHTDVTTTRGTLNKTFYSGSWASNSRSHYATTGSFFEVVFDGSKVQLSGLTKVGHGIGRVSVDDAVIGTVDYGGTTNSTSRILFTSGTLVEGRHTVRVDIEGWVDHSSATFISTAAQPVTTELEAVHRFATGLEQADHTAASWPSFQAARDEAATIIAGGGTQAERDAALARLRTAQAALVEVGGLRDIVGDYLTRTPSDFTQATWEPFAAALSAAQDVSAAADSSQAAVVEAKNALLDTAAELVTVTDGSFESITNNTFWTDTDGNPIYSQGGGIFRFGDTYYWYGVHYQEAESYRASPSKAYATSTFASIPVYSSKDLVNWTFENDIATRDTEITIPPSKGEYFAQMKTLADATWLGRLGVTYNENTGKYTLLIQMNQPFDPASVQRSAVLFLQGDSPTDDFGYGNIQAQIANSPTTSTGDQTVFTDEDGTDYLIFSNRTGRSNAFVSKISDSDSLTIEPAVRVGYVAAGREGNAMFRLGDTYYMLTSDLHGWNASANHVIESMTGDVQGSYTPEYTLAGTEKDYSLVSQTGFFVTVHGTEQDTVVYAGDRWSDFAWNGNGYNQWVPLSADGGELEFNSLTDWQLNAVTGEWRVGDENNYVLNPDFAADRVEVTDLTGWETSIDTSYPSNSFVSNSSPGADSSRFALKLGNASAFSGAISQEISVPDGRYRLTAKVNTPGGLEYARIRVTGGAGEDHVLDLNAATSGWQTIELDGLALTAGTATIAIEVRSAGGAQVVRVDALSLIQEQTDVSALQALVDRSSGLGSSDYTSGTWSPFATALSDAAAVLASSSSGQGDIDAAESRLEAASAALAPAVRSITATTSQNVYAVGDGFDARTVTVSAVRADGATAVLAPDEYTVGGFSSDQPGERLLLVTVDPELVATGSDPLTATVAVSVYHRWGATATYTGGERVLWNSSLWLASWWTRGQTPGDPNGPWQEMREENGIAVWTPSRTFVAGDRAVLDGQSYTARWWTRNQKPGDPDGPWLKIG